MKTHEHIFISRCVFFPCPWFSFSLSFPPFQKQNSYYPWLLHAQRAVSPLYTRLNTWMQERSKFGKIGWNANYDFNEFDYDTSVKVLSAFLQSTTCSFESRFQWNDLKFLIGEVSEWCVYLFPILCSLRCFFFFSSFHSFSAFIRCRLLACTCNIFAIDRRCQLNRQTETALNQYALHIFRLLTLNCWRWFGWVRRWLLLLLLKLIEAGASTSTIWVN